MDDNLIKNAREILASFIKMVEDFPADKFNSIPFEGSWTAAQVTDHLLKAVSGLPEMLETDVEKTDRHPGEKIGAIEAVFLDFSTKLKSPDFILPENGQLDKAYLLNGWEATRKKLLDVITRLDLSMTSTAYELPGMGSFTRFEWIWFALCHIRRHTYQLKNIHHAIVKSIPAQAD